MPKLIFILLVSTILSSSPVFAQCSSCGPDGSTTAGKQKIQVTLSEIERWGTAADTFNVAQDDKVVFSKSIGATATTANFNMTLPSGTYSAYLSEGDQQTITTFAMDFSLTESSCDVSIEGVPVDNIEFSFASSLLSFDINCCGSGEEEKPGTVKSDVNSIDCAMFLGGDGSLIHLYASDFGPDTFSPSILQFFGQDNAKAVWKIDDPDHLRQVWNDEVLIDILTNTPPLAAGYTLNYYDKAIFAGLTPTNGGCPACFSYYQGIYPIPTNATPDIVITITDDSPNATTSRLELVRSENGNTEEHIWEQDSNTGIWSLFKTIDGSPFRITNQELGPGRHLKTADRFPLTNSVISKVETVTTEFPWGTETVTNIVYHSGYSNLVTVTRFETNVASNAYGKVIQREYPDGSWEKFAYDPDGNRSKVIRPWLDSVLTDPESLHHVTTFVHERTTTNLMVQEVTTNLPWFVAEQSTYILDERVSLTEREISAGTETDSWGYPVHMLTTVRRYANATDFLETHTQSWNPYNPYIDEARRGQLIESTTADGRLTTYEIDEGNFNPANNSFSVASGGDDVRRISLHTHTNAPNGTPWKTTRQISIANDDDEILHARTELLTAAPDTWETIREENHTYDASGNQLTTTRNNQLVYEAGYDADDKLLWQIDSQGIRTEYFYDAWDRQNKTIQKGLPATNGYPATSDITTTNTFDQRGRIVSSTRSAGGLSLTSTQTYLDPFTQSSTSPQGLVSLSTRDPIQRTSTRIQPGGALTVSTAHLDGQTHSVTGSATVAQYFEYGITNHNGHTVRRQVVRQLSPTGPRYQETLTDWLGRTVLTRQPAFGGATFSPAESESTYNAMGQLVKRTAPLTADTLYQYDSLGELAYQGLDLNANGQLDLNGIDRVTGQTQGYTNTAEGTWQFQRQSTFETANDATETVLQTSLQGLIAPNGDELREQRSIDRDGNVSTSSYAIDRALGLTIQSNQAAGVSVPAVQHIRNGQAVLAENPNGSTMSYLYDALGRPTIQIDSSAGTNQTVYAANGQVTWTVEPNGATNHFGYDGQTGRMIAHTNAAGGTRFYRYDDSRERHLPVGHRRLSGAL